MTASAATVSPPGAGELRRRELAEFLRSRRERIAPQQVGVMYTGRRRTPGLRREEVAQLSGVGVTWYTWLEQGRDINVSEQVLAAIARTLLLDRDERAHLFTLAGAAHAPGTVVGECHAVTAPLRAMLTQLEPFPACIQSGKYDVLAYNRAYRNLIVDFDALAVEERNCMWLTFTDPRWRKRVVDWEESAAKMVANLRNAMADHVGDATWKAFVARLQAASPEFTELWARHEVRAITDKPKRLRHPDVGMMRFQATNTWLGPRSTRRMLVYVPADAETQRRVQILMEA